MHATGRIGWRSVWACAVALAIGLLSGRASLAAEPTPGYEAWLQEYVQLTEAMAGVLGLVGDEASARRIADPLRELSAKWFYHQLNTEGVASQTNPADTALGEKYGPRIQKRVEALGTQLQRIQQLPDEAAASIVQQAMAEGQAEAQRAMARQQQQAERNQQRQQQEDDVGSPSEPSTPAPSPRSEGGELADNDPDAILAEMTRQLRTITAAMSRIDTVADVPRETDEIARAGNALQAASQRFGALSPEQQSAVRPQRMMRLNAANQEYQQQMQRLSRKPAVMLALKQATSQSPRQPQDQPRQGHDKPHGVAEGAARMKGLAGVWASSRFDTYTGTMILNYLTFFPGGVIYGDIAPGWERMVFDRDGLPEDREELGRYTVNGRHATIRWEDGEAERLTLNASDAIEFTDRGTYRHYVKVQPIAPGSRWDASFSRASSVKAMAAGGVSGMFGKTIRFKRDGTFMMKLFGTMDYDSTSAGQADDTLGDQRRSGVGLERVKGRGRYAFDGYHLTLKDVGGKTKTVTCFSIDWDDEDPAPNLLWIKDVGTFMR